MKWSVLNGLEGGELKRVMQGKIKEQDRIKSAQSSLSRSFKFLKEKNKNLPKEKRPVYIPYDLEKSIWVDNRRFGKYLNEVKSNRKRTNGDERSKFEKEMEIANLLKKEGLGTILIDENHDEKGVKHLDAVVNGKFSEFKKVTGKSEKSVENEIKRALKQEAKVIYLNIVEPIPLPSVKNKINIHLEKHPDVEFYFFLNGIFYGKSK